MKKMVLTYLLLLSTFLLSASTDLDSNFATKIDNTNVQFATSTELRPQYRIGFEAPEVDHRQLLLTIDENTTDGVDWGYDAMCYQSFNDDMFWIIDGGEYIIQATNSISANKEFPLAIQSKNGGTVKIKIDEISNPLEGFVLVIKNLQTGEIHELETNEFYLELTSDTYNEEYAICFRDASEPAIDEPFDIGSDLKDSDTESIQTIDTNAVFAANTIKIFFNASENSICVDNKKLITLNQLNLFTITGLHVESWNINSTPASYLTFKVQQNKGVYIAQVATENGSISKRILIK